MINSIQTIQIVKSILYIISIKTNHNFQKNGAKILQNFSTGTFQNNTKK